MIQNTKTKSAKNFIITIFIGVVGGGIAFCYENLNRSLSNETEVPQNISSVNKIDAEKREETKKYTCDICGSKINRNVYCRDDNGVWKPCTDNDNIISPIICSYSCAMKKQQEIDNAWQKVDKKLEENTNNNSDDYYSRERERMKIKGYTQGEIDQMRDPNQTDPDIKMPDLNKH